LKYAGFWSRVGASTIDTILTLIIVIPLMLMIYVRDYLSSTSTMGFWDAIFSYVFPVAAVLLFWVYKAATPGKMALGMKIVDARTGGVATKGQFIKRYLGYIVATLPFGLGILWVAFDKRKQGWHDKIAGTVVVREERSEVAQFDEEDQPADATI